MKRMATWLLGLSASLFLSLSPAQAQTSSDYSQGVDVSGSTATIWFAPTSSSTTWVNAHYQVNGGDLQNLAMGLNGSRDELKVLTPVAKGDVITYSFTYNKPPAFDSQGYSFTVGATGGGGGNGKKAAAPTFTPGAGTYVSSVDVSLNSASAGAAIHYTLDGNKPTKKSPTYTGPIHLTQNATVKALAVVPGLKNSAVATAAYTITTDGGGGGTWNKQTTFSLVNNTHGTYPDSQVYWAIIGKDWVTGQFVHVDTAGHLVPMALGDNGQLTKNGLKYSNYFHTLAEAKQVTIPPINSARLMLSVGSPMYLQVQQDINGNLGYSGANIENPSDPNIDVYFDFVEMAIVPESGFFGNTTRVDQFGFPVTLRLQGLNNYDQTVGETESRAALTSAYQAAVPNEFKGLGQAPFSPYRIIAPAHATFINGQPNGTYLDSYIASLWSKYSSQNLVFTDQQGTFTGHVVNGAFQFTDGQGTYTIARAPSTSEALLGNGVLNDATGQTPGSSGYDKQLQIQAQLCAAINRHIVEDPAHWSTPANFYAAGQAANWYAKFWHDHGINGLAYGFAYDDVGGFSSSLHTNAPTTATVTIGW